MVLALIAAAVAGGWNWRPPAPPAPPDQISPERPRTVIIAGSRASRAGLLIVEHGGSMK